MSSIVTVTVVVPSGIEAMAALGCVPPFTALLGVVAVSLETALVEIVPLLVTVAVVAATPVEGSVPCGVAVTVVVPAALPVVSSAMACVPSARSLAVTVVGLTVSSELSDMATVSTEVGWVVLPAASLRVSVRAPAWPTRTVCVAGVSVMLVGAPAVANEKETVSVPL